VQLSSNGDLRKQRRKCRGLITGINKKEAAKKQPLFFMDSLEIARKYF
jgi:hypothetical protein